MNIQVTVETGDVKGGRSARAADFRLVCHGKNDEEARRLLAFGVLAYCEALDRFESGAVGKLAQRRGVAVSNLDEPGFRAFLSDPELGDQT